MIVDSSALIAILLLEPEARRLSISLAESLTNKISAANYLEASMVMLGRDEQAGLSALDAVISKARIEILPFTAQQAHLARLAFDLFGKGRHPAALNFGDCISYALAKETDEPLLFKGTDFGLTDIRIAPY